MDRAREERSLLSKIEHDTVFDKLSVHKKLIVLLNM